KIAINQADADAGFGTDVVHAGLVKPALGKTNDSGIKYLGTSIGISRFYLGLRHRFGKMNERSFIVKRPAPIYWFRCRSVWRPDALVWPPIMETRRPRRAAARGRAGSNLAEGRPCARLRLRIQHCLHGVM